MRKFSTERWEFFTARTGTRDVVALALLFAGAPACSAGGAEPSPAGAAAPSDTGPPPPGIAAPPLLGSGGTQQQQQVPGSSGQTPVAGAGGAPALGAAGSAAGQYDPSITFDWPEATVTSGTCKAGHYQGTFSGDYTSPATGGGWVKVSIPVAGNIDLTLNESQDGEFLEIANGTLSGMANLTTPFGSGVRGRLNCTTSKLEDGFMFDGKYDVFGAQYFYEGPLVGDYDKVTHSFVNGSWQVGEPTFHPPDPPPPYGGLGTWTAAWVGP